MSGGLHLIARIAGRTVAFAAQDIESVVDIGPITPTPRAQPGVSGLVALRSRVATVIDPRVALGLGTGGDTPTRAVVGRVEGHLYAVQVEALEDVASYEVGALPPGTRLGDGWDGAAQGVIDLAGEPVLVIALARLIPPAGQQAA